MRRLLLLITLLAALAAFPASALADEPPPGSKWEEAYIATGDPEIRSLHADILRPENLPEGAKAPVIMTVSPYTAHSGESPTEYNPAKTGPSHRFYDFLEVGKVFEKGYIYVIVDLPGTGGSDGCTDWGGPVEQRATKYAVEWAATQDFSNGKVALMGKSYDGWTGLMGIGQKPKGLAAVLAMEPVYSGYRYYYTNGVRLGTRSALTTAAFQVGDLRPGTTTDDPMYWANGAPKGYCYGVNLGGAQTDTEDSVYWNERNLLPKVKGASTPLFLTQGFLEDNTLQDAAFDVFNGMAGAKRAWFGQFAHIRGWEGCAEECLAGKTDFAEQMMRFLGTHLKDEKNAPDPEVEVQSAPDGKWRAERAWPPADSVLRTSQLKPGSYTDDGENRGAGEGAGEGVWTFSQPLPYRAHMAGEPVITASLSGVPQGNFVVNVYDVAPDNKATLVSRSAWLMRSGTESEISFKLYGQDWIFEPGHRVGVLLSGANSEWWLHAPTGAQIDVEQATISLPWLTYARSEFLPGQSTSRLQSWLEASTLTVDPSKIAEGESSFDLPAKLAPMPGKPLGDKAGPSLKLTAKARYAKKKRRLTVLGTATSGSKVTVTVKRGKKRVARRTVTARKNRYAVKVKLRKRGRYTIVVTSGTQEARTRARAS